MAPSDVDRLLPSKPEVDPRVYAYALESRPGELKVGQTSRDVRQRIAEQTKTAGLHPQILVDDDRLKADGSLFSDRDVHRRLKAKGFANPEGEWFACSVDDVKTVITEIRTGTELSGTHHETFAMRPEQADAVNQTCEYFESRWAEDEKAVPRFLWNAKMRFGKTFAAYQLAKELDAMKVLVLTFKPAVEDAWEQDLKTHADFDGWQYLSRASGRDWENLDKSRPFVYFGSFQDLLGTDKSGGIKAKNEWLHTTNWDLVVFDEYHFGAWRDTVTELFEGEDDRTVKKAKAQEFNTNLDKFHELRGDLGEDEEEFLPITTRAYLYLSGTPFRALRSGEFIEEQIFNWTYSDEQRAKRDWDSEHPGEPNPYLTLPEMRLFTYQMPDELVAIASQGEFNEFDLNEFFAATVVDGVAEFTHKSDVQKWLDIIRGEYSGTQTDNLKLGAKKPPYPYSDVRLLPYLQHSFWFLPSVAACDAMANLLAERHNVFYHDYNVLSVAGSNVGTGIDALPPVRKAIDGGHDTKTITLSCGKLTTGVTVPQWSSILMLKNLQSPETYFQAAFRVQSPWAISNPNGDDPNEIEIVKPVCFVFDFAPTRALRQLSEYSFRLSPEADNPEAALDELIGFLPVLAYNGSTMQAVNAADVLDIAMSGTSATLLARKWESAILVNVDNDTLKRIMKDQRALSAIMNIEGFRKLGSEVFETIVNKSEHVKDTKKKKGDKISPIEKKELTKEEREYKSLRKQVQDNLRKFATRIPAFMYLTDYRENKLKDVITKIEPDLFKTVTGLTVQDFDLLVSLNVFNSTQMNDSVYAFRRYEDASLNYTGIDSHKGETKTGLFDTVILEEVTG